MSEAGDVHDDERGIHAQELVVVYAELVEPDHVFDEYVALADEAEEDLVRVAAVGPELQGHGEAVARLLYPGRAHARALLIAGEGTEGPVCVARRGPLYLYDLRAELGQHARGKGHGYERAGADDAHARERAELRDDEFPF